MHPDIERIIKGIIQAEGGYVNHPSDRGGPTKYGITLATLRSWRKDVGLAARDVAAITEHEATQIYLTQYVYRPRFDRILAVSVPVAAELVDAGVLSGPTWPVKWLQTALNAMNRRQTLYADITVDGVIGLKTIEALTAYLKTRGDDAESVLLRALNSQQGAFFLEISQTRPANEDFVFGWFRHRVVG